MRYLYSKLEYDEHIIIDVYVNFTWNEVPQCIELAAKHLLNANNFIRQPTLLLPAAESLPFTGGRLVFVKRTKSTPRKTALEGALFYDNN